MGRRTRLRPNGGLIASVEPGSIAARLGLCEGDRLLAINGKQLRDVIDYRYEACEEYLSLRVKRGESILNLRCEKELDEDLGIGFELAVFDNIIECHNRCSFCFIHQMARGLRPSLYIMDDDYRLSFLQGNFVTLTNMKPADWKRVYQDRLSPLNVSVHATRPEVRREMIKHPEAGRIMAQLRRLIAHGIDVNAQIVFVPGQNDGAELDRTLGDLHQLGPSLRAIAIVPVGLSQFRQHLPKLSPVSPELARATIRQVKAWQKRFLESHGDPVVRLGDEFYLIAGETMPKASHYGEYDQLGDGVGGAALMAQEFRQLEKHLPEALPQRRVVSVVTGQAGAPSVKPIVERLNRIHNLEVRLWSLASEFWGPMITVTGLLTYQDLTQKLQGQDLGDELVISRIMLKDGTDLMLDGKRVPELAEALGLPVVAVDNAAGGLLLGVLRDLAPTFKGPARRYHNPYEPDALPLAALN